ncbi:MAG: hypothetical protein QXN87_06855 [Candidatus Bathyarchaeia archaeon]
MKALTKLQGLVIILIILIGILLGCSILLQTESPPQSVPSTLTIQDELLNNGNRMWLTEIIIPSLNTPWMFNLQDFGSGPQVERVEQIDSETVKIVGFKGSMEIVSKPSRGYRKITVKTNFNSTNFTPGLKAGDVLEHWEEVPPTKSSSPVDVPEIGTYGAEGFGSYGKAILYRDGAKYEGLGRYGKITAKRMRDPYPGYYQQSGWVSNSEFVLFNSNVNGLEGSTLQWRNGQREKVTVNVQTEDYQNYTFTFTSSRGKITINLSIRAVVGVLGKYGVGAGTSNSNIGGQGYAWQTVAR